MSNIYFNFKMLYIRINLQFNIDKFLELCSQPIKCNNQNEKISTKISVIIPVYFARYFYKCNRSKKRKNSKTQLGCIDIL